MFIPEFENIQVKLKTTQQCGRWKNKLGYLPNPNELISVHWSVLKTTSYRRNRILVTCDECKKNFKKRICDLDESISAHLCKTCTIKGERNPQFRKPYSLNAKIGITNWFQKNGNPFTWESTKAKIKNKNGWKITAEKNRGSHRTVDSKIKMSTAAKLAFKKGTRVPSNRWGTAKILYYNGIAYQSSYELRFLKYVDSINKLNLIERGPIIEYLGPDEKIHNYFIDYRIKNTNTCIEIKSSYLLKKYPELTKLKKEAAGKIVDYHLILDNKFDKIDALFIDNTERAL